MNIIVLGAGTVGRSISEMLCDHKHSVTVIDANPTLVREIDSDLDVRAICGSASDTSTLFQAGVLTSDLLLAMTGSDEVNILVGSTSKAMGTHRAVARVYAPSLLDVSTFDYQRHFNIDRLLSIEQLSAIELAQAIRSPGSVSMENFARGHLEMQSIGIDEKTPAVGVPLSELDLPKVVRIGSISRDGEHKIASADDKLAVGDQITLLGRREDIDDVRDLFQNAPPPKRGVVIAGGGETGYHLARLLEGRRFAIVLMERDPERCAWLSQRLRHVTVVLSDATRRHNLEEERVGTADVFVACTGDDENNIMAGVESRELGAKTIMAIVNRPDYANVVEKLGIDHAVSPRSTIARQILGFLTSGPVVSQIALGDGSINVMEIEVEAGVPATEHVLAGLDLPRECIIAAIMRQEYVRVPGADDRLRGGDVAVALVGNGAVNETLRHFEPR